MHEDLLDLSFKPATFDHIFGSFVLEHVHQPHTLLKILKPQLRPEGTINLIEGDFGSIHFYPDSDNAHQAIQCQATLQQQAGGNPNIGRELYLLLKTAEFSKITVHPIAVYSTHDNAIPQYNGFVEHIFAPMIAGVRDVAIAANIIDQKTFDQGIQDLYRTTQPGGIFGITLYSVIAH